MSTGIQNNTTRAEPLSIHPKWYLFVLLKDYSFFVEARPYIDETIFDEDVYVRKLFDIYDQCCKYNQRPVATSLFKEIVSKELKDDELFLNNCMSIVEEMENLKEEEYLNYVRHNFLEYIRYKNTMNCLQKSSILAKSGQYRRVESVIKDALKKINLDYSPGMVLQDSIENRYNNQSRRTISTGLPEIDHRTILNGGAGAGELCVIIAATGVGKSHVLVHMGAEALKQGKNVLHYTFELREKVVAIRYDSNLVGIDYSDCFEQKELIKRYYEVNKHRLGKLYIKEYPTGTATVGMLKSHIEKLKQINNFVPDMVIVDYAGIMRSSEKFDLIRLELKRIFEELRELAMELDIPIWTASQSNREGAKNDVVALTNIAEAYAQAHVCDFVMSLSRKETEKESGIGTLFIAKNRAGKDGITFKVKLDTAQSRLKILNGDNIKKLEITNDGEAKVKDKNGHANKFEYEYENINESYDMEQLNQTN